MKKRILIIQPWISYRGAETISLLQVLGLKKLGLDVKVACLYVDKNKISPIFDEIEYILPPYFLSKLFASSKFFLMIFGIPTLFFLVLKNINKYDVFNAHNLPSSWICALIKPFSKKQMIWTVHGVVKNSYKKTSLIEKIIGSAAKGRIDYWAARKMDRIISESKRVAFVIKVKYGRESDVLYSAISLEDFKDITDIKIKRKLRLGKNDFILLHLSYLHPAKNIELTIKVFKKILRHIPNAKLLIVGEGKHKRNLEILLTELEINDKAIFTGFYPPHKIAKIYNICDLILVPYYETEGCPSVPFEGLLMGKISVVAKNSGADEIIKKEKIGIVSKPTVGDFTNAILNFYKNKEKWKQTAVLGKKYVLANLSDLSYARGFLNIINKR